MRIDVLLMGERSDRVTDRLSASETDDLCEASLATEPRPTFILE